ncbi:MAG: outer membrane lipoprotein-sorting protein [Verrucomicrobiota bacterium]
MKKNPQIITLGLLATLIAAPFASAMTPEERGLEIARESDKRDTGFGDTVSDMEMVLENRHGETSTRKMTLKTLEGIGEGDKTLITFDQPRDVKGTAFLSFTKKVGPDDQWLYLPALKRVKRISSNNKSGPFVGSEFAYEDMTSQEVEKYTYKFLREEELDGEKCFVIERYPVDPKSGYTRQISWIDQEHYRVMQIDFFDRKNELLKTLTFNGYQQYLDKFWRPELMRMENHQTGKNTDLGWSNYRFANGYNDRDFDRRSLENAR